MKVLGSYQIVSGQILVIGRLVRVVTCTLVGYIHTLVGTVEIGLPYCASIDDSILFG